MNLRIAVAVLAALLPCSADANRAAAQAPATDAGVQLATAATPLPPVRPGEVVRFKQKPTEVGDRAVQRLGVQLGIATKIVQSGQIAHESTNEMRRQQQRTIEVLELAEGRATKVRASFEVSRRQAPDAEDPNVLAKQPIEGKSYLMTRTGDELKVTDLEGMIPPLEEYKLVAESLQNVGQPNPLSKILLDRRLAVGERILVPRDMVRELMGFEEPLGMVKRFEMTLVRVEPASAKHPLPLAVFQTAIEVSPTESAPLAITLSGEMVVEIETCRLAWMQLAGPVTISSIERTEGGIFQFTAGGELKVAIEAQYDHPRVAQNAR